VLAFTSVYFSESRLFNGLRPADVRKTKPRLKLRAKRLKPLSFPFSTGRRPGRAWGLIRCAYHTEDHSRGFWFSSRKCPLIRGFPWSGGRFQGLAGPGRAPSAVMETPCSTPSCSGSSRSRRPGDPGRRGKTEAIRASTNFVLEMFQFLFYPLAWVKRGRPQPCPGSRWRWRSRIVSFRSCDPRTVLCNT